MGERTRWTDRRLPLGRDCELRLVERPGAHLDFCELATLVEDMRRVADGCVPDVPLRYGVLSGERERLAHAILAVAYERKSGRAVGFSAMVDLDLTVDGRATRVVHAGLCMIDREYRSRGLCLALTTAPALLAFLRNRLTPLWFTNVTQVPAVAGVFTGALADVYPSPEGPASPPSAHAAIVGEIMCRHRSAFGVGEDADFDPRAFVIRNAYTGGSDGLKKSFSSCPKHRDARFNAWCRELLDYERGDDVIQLGRMTLGQWGRLALHFVGKMLRTAPRRPREPRRTRAGGVELTEGARS